MRALNKPVMSVQDLQRNSGSACGMVQSNFLGTEFTIYDGGMSGVTALSPKGDAPSMLLFYTALQLS